MALTKFISTAKSLVFRSSKLMAPVAAGLGGIADTAAVLGPVALYCSILFGITMILSGYMWFRQYQKAARETAANGPDEAPVTPERGGFWSISCAFSCIAAVVMGLFAAAGSLWAEEEQGILATVSPQIQQLQQSVFRIQKKVDQIASDTTEIKADTSAIKDTTASIKADTTDLKSGQERLESMATKQGETGDSILKNTEKIAASLDDIASRFDSLSQSGGLIAQPSTPEQYYHNARLQEINGDYAGARKSYTAYLGEKLDFIDPWINYGTLLRMQDGREGAMEIFQQLTRPEANPPVAAQAAFALMKERTDRLAALEKLRADNPEYGPIAWLLAKEYSREKLGNQTLEDQRSERKWTEAYRKAGTEGQVLRYFLDKKEAKNWEEQAETAWARLSQIPMLDNPVTLTTMNTNGGLMLVFQVGDFQIKELFYRLDGAGDFISTGHLPQTNAQTGLAQVNSTVPVGKLSPGAHKVEVKYTDLRDATNGPYELKFNTDNETLKQVKQMAALTATSWLSFRDYDGKTLLYFTGVLGWRPALEKIEYSLDGEALDKTYDFPPSDTLYEVPDNIYIEVPDTTKSASIRLTYKDGTKSDIKTINR